MAASRWSRAAAGTGRQSNDAIPRRARPALFYDADLSIDGTMACATCHEQHRGFAEGNVTHGGVHESLVYGTCLASPTWPGCRALPGAIRAYAG